VHTSKGILESVVLYFDALRDILAGHEGSTRTTLAIMDVKDECIQNLGHALSACRVIRSALSPLRSRFDIYWTIHRPTARKGCSFVWCL